MNSDASPPLNGQASSTENSWKPFARLFLRWPRVSSGCSPFLPVAVTCGRAVPKSSLPGTNETTRPDACTPLSVEAASSDVYGVLVGGSSDDEAIGALKDEKHILGVVVSVLARFSAIIFSITTTLMYRGRKGVEYAPVFFKGDNPGNDEKRSLTDPYEHGHAIQRGCTGSV